MEPLCYIWHCQRMGWLTKTSVYSTDLTQARQFGLSEATKFAARQNDGTGIRVLVIRAEDLDASLRSS